MSAPTCLVCRDFVRKASMDRCDRCEELERLMAENTELRSIAAETVAVAKRWRSTCEGAIDKYEAALSMNRAVANAARQELARQLVGADALAAAMYELPGMDLQDYEQHAPDVLDAIRAALKACGVEVKP